MRAMTDEECVNPKLERGAADERRVRDAMLAAPKTLPAESTVADLRRVFANPHVVTALLVDGTRFVGAVEREAVASAQTPDAAPARHLTGPDVGTITPDEPMTAAMAMLDERGERRLVVLDPDGRTLRGLLCLTSDRSGFCGAPAGSAT